MIGGGKTSHEAEQNIFEKDWTFLKQETFQQEWTNTFAKYFEGIQNESAFSSFVFVFVGLSIFK